MERKGICKNVGVCTLAGKVQVITDDDAEFKCTECGEELEEAKEEPIPVGPNPNRKWIFIALAIILLAVIGFGFYSFVGKAKKPTAIKLAQKELVMKVGETQVITPTVEPEGKKATFIFESQNKIVKITNGGEITALKKGEDTICVKCEENPELHAICKVTIKEEETGGGGGTESTFVDKMTIKEGNFTLKAGKTRQLTKTVAPKKHDELLSWSSDNEEVATVDQSGLVKALKAGTATIVLTTDKSEKQAQVTVTVVETAGPDPRPVSEIERYGKYSGAREGGLPNGLPDGTGKVTFFKPYRLNAEYTAQPGEYIQGIFENGKPSFVTYYQKDGTVTKIKLR